MSDVTHSEYRPEHPRATPDPYTNLWWREQIKGILHSVNRCNAEYAGAQDQIERLESRCERLESQLVDSQAEIGKLRGELDEKIEAIRQAYKELKNGH